MILMSIEFGDPLWPILSCGRQVQVRKVGSLNACRQTLQGIFETRLGVCRGCKVCSLRIRRDPRKIIVETSRWLCQRPKVCILICRWNASECIFFERSRGLFLEQTRIQLRLVIFVEVVVIPISAEHDPVVEILEVVPHQAERVVCGFIGLLHIRRGRQHRCRVNVQFYKSLSYAW